MRRLICAGLLLGLMPSLTAAQTPLRVERFAAPAVDAPPAATTKMIVAGIVGGAVGLFAGGYAGALLTNEQDCELCFLPGLFAGAVLGESVLMPVGVHLANSRRGRVVPAVLASVAIGAAGALAAYGTQDSDPLPGIILGVTPIAQLITSITIERRTSR